MASAADYLAIDAALAAVYGGGSGPDSASLEVGAVLGPGKTPLLALGRRNILDTLILTILSQATNDRNSAQAYRDLKAAFPGWEAALRAPTDNLAEAIRHGGLADQKAPRIQGILGRIKADRGRFDLEFLRDWPPERAFEYLTGFNGVGPKTAACTLLFAARHPFFPVDTHILRIARRMGLVPPKSTAEAAQRQLQVDIPPELHYRLHVNLIEHGRAVCHPRNPGCPECLLRRWCAWGQSQQALKLVRRKRFHAPANRIIPL